MTFLPLGLKASLETLHEIINNPAANKGIIRIWSDQNAILHGTVQLDGEEWIKEDSDDILVLIRNMGEAAQRLIR